MAYLDFDLIIESAGEDYVARVAGSPVGEAKTRFKFPFTEDGLEDFILKIGRTRTGVRRIHSPQMDAARAFGGELYDAVFVREVGTIFERSLDEAERQGRGLRVRLRLSDAPTLSEVPWEFLYSPALARFLVLSIDTPLVRFVDLPQKIRALHVTPPLRVLVVVSSPTGVASLDAQGELGLLEEATAQLRTEGRIELQVLENATLEDLRKRLKNGITHGMAFHVLHFIGHGGFDDDNGDGILLFENGDPSGRPVSGRDLGVILHDHRTLRLVVLNACEGARTSSREPLGGVAQRLVVQGIPAVIAMQFEVTDKAAKVFAHELYVGLSDGQPIDAAANEARRAVFTSDNDVEWATPVLYLRAPEGNIFSLDPAPPSADPATAEASAVARAGVSKSLHGFDVGKPVHDPRYFFGRGRELARLLQRLGKRPLENVAIIGPRRSGKTSLLLHLRDIARARPGDLRLEQRKYQREALETYRWVYADFHNPRVRTQAGLLRHLLAGLNVQPREDVNLETFLDLVSTLMNSPIVFLFDEVGVALQRYSQEFDDTFWGAMRSLVMSREGSNIAFVLAMHESPYEMADVSGSESPFFNIFGFTARLGPFTDEEARELVMSSPIPFASEDVEWIIQQSVRWPILLQILCSERLNALLEGDTTDSWRGDALAQIKQHSHLLSYQAW